MVSAKDTSWRRAAPRGADPIGSLGAGRGPRFRDLGRSFGSFQSSQAPYLTAHLHATEAKVCLVIPIDSGAKWQAWPTSLREARMS